MKVYPIFLVGLNQNRCIVVGGGREAQSKVKGLLECDATVTIICAKITKQLRVWVNETRIDWIDRDYQSGDLKGAHLVISTEHDLQVNEQIWKDAESEGALINVVDDPTHCNFIAGSIVRQGALTIAISTSGSAPDLAVRLRERMEREFGPEYSAFLELMKSLRTVMAARFPDFAERRARWYTLIDSDILDQLRAGRTEIARQRISEIIGETSLL